MFWLVLLLGVLVGWAALWLDERVTGRQPWPWSPGRGKHRRHQPAPSEPEYIVVCRRSDMEW